MLYEQITSDLKTAMKAHDAARVEVIRFALAGINGVQKEKNAKEPGVALTDEEIISVLQKDVKRRRDSIELFKQGHRDDLVAKEEADLVILGAYLPKELTREELEKIVGDLKAAGNADFNSLMKETMKVVKGKADGRMVGEVIRTHLKNS